MKSLDVVAAVAVIALRLLWIPLRQAPVDWIVVVALFWIAHSLAPEKSRTRDLVLGAAGVWLTAIYAWHQAPSTWMGVAQF